MCFYFCPCKILVNPSVKNSASRSFHSSPKKSPVHSLLTSSAEESIGSTSQYRSTKTARSAESVKGKDDLTSLMRLTDFPALVKGKSLSITRIRCYMVFLYSSSDSWLWNLSGLT